MGKQARRDRGAAPGIGLVQDGKRGRAKATRKA